MIRFVFDNNALEELFGDSGFAKINQSLRESIDRRQNQFFCTGANIQEVCSGLTESNFERLKTIVKRAFELLGTEGLLLDVHDHLLIDLNRGHFSTDDVTIKRNKFNHELRLLFTAKNYHQWYSEFGDQVELFNNAAETHRIYLTDSLKKSRESASGWNKKEIPKNLGLEEAGGFLDQFMRVVAASILDCRESDIADSEELRKACPGLAYWGEMYCALQLEGTRSPRNVKRGDPFDCQHVSYLDVADYLVTKDRSLKHLTGLMVPYPLKRRVIKPSEFLEHIERPFLPSRSPFSPDIAGVYPKPLVPPLSI